MTSVYFPILVWEYLKQIMIKKKVKLSEAEACIIFKFWIKERDHVKSNEICYVCLL